MKLFLHALDQRQSCVNLFLCDFRMAVMAATDWLIQNENDPDIDTPLPEQEDPPPSASSQETTVSLTSPLVGKGGGGG